jgi:hypothetical protein
VSPPFISSKSEHPFIVIDNAVSLVKETLYTIYADVECSIQAPDEAWHIKVFTRRALLKSPQLGLSTSVGQASLQTLVLEAHFAPASFLLSVLGKGTFLTLLWFTTVRARSTREADTDAKRP